ncbi:MAG: hypothetical protein RLZZ519_1401 [Bacteroidota bacterium]|jgi:hypothetical protein
MYERALWEDEVAGLFINRAFWEDEKAGSPSGDVWVRAYGAVAIFTPYALAHTVFALAHTVFALARTVFA